MKERPIIFSPEMVQAILEGRKTQTRREIKPQPDKIDIWQNPTRFVAITNDNSSPLVCPYGKIGDRLWVRGTYSLAKEPCNDKTIFYKASHGNIIRECSRITLEITNIRVEKLQDISLEDAIAEGVNCWICNGNKIDGTSENDCGCFHSKKEAKRSFETLWESIKGKGSWDKNPFVWVVEFKVITK